MTRTPLEFVTYETVETITLTVSEMLALTSALFDAANWNEEHNYPQSAAAIHKLRKELIEPQCEDFINEADRKVCEWRQAADDRQQQKADEDAAARAEMEDDKYFIEADNCDDGQGPRQEFTTGKSELES